MTRKMFSACAIGLTVASLTILASSASATVTFDWATVGNPGNPADPTTGFGAVSYEYRISKTEVTNAQYAEFLNMKAVSDPNGLYNPSMDVLTDRGGITRSGSSGSYTYTTRPNMANKPVNWVSFFDAMRFANWLHNGQGAGSTETGAYSIANGRSEIRDANATIFLPSEDEWYKAAYHQPVAQGGDSDNYWLYPTASNSLPTNGTANSVGGISNPGANIANYNFGADWNDQDGNVTTEGSAGPISASFYGTFDQGGNVWEWSEGLIAGSKRVFRGGSWFSPEGDLRSSTRGNVQPFFVGSATLGFRVASPIPIEGDLNGDGFVGIDDLNIVLSNWNENVPPADPAADPSGNGFVGIADLNFVLGNWNAGTPPPVEASNVVPEPAALVVLGFGVPILLRRKELPK